MVVRDIQMKRLIKKGFTLIELMIVIAIIGVLSVVLIPKALPLKNQAKNNAVQANVYIVRSFLENRAGADRASIVSSLGTNTDITSIANTLSPIKDNIGLTMTTAFSGSSAMKNPFNSNTAINNAAMNYTNLTIGNSSVVVGYDTTSIPTNVSNITSTVTTPGVTAIIVYQTGYVVYGIDILGKVIQPTLVNMPNMPNRVGQLPVITNPPIPTTPVSDPTLTGDSKIVSDFLKSRVSLDILTWNGNSTSMASDLYTDMLSVFAPNSTNQILNPFNSAANSIVNKSTNVYDTGNKYSVIISPNGTFTDTTLSKYKGCVFINVLSSGSGYQVKYVDGNGVISVGSQIIATLDNIKPSVDANVLYVVHNIRIDWDSTLRNPLIGGVIGIWVSSYNNSPLYSVLIENGNKIDFTNYKNTATTDFHNYRGVVVINWVYATSCRAQVYGIYSDGTISSPTYNIDSSGNITSIP